MNPAKNTQISHFDLRREINYIDLGGRQSIHPSNLSRATMDSIKATHPQEDDNLVFASEDLSHTSKDQRQPADISEDTTSDANPFFAGPCCPNRSKCIHKRTEENDTGSFSAKWLDHVTRHDQESYTMKQTYMLFPSRQLLTASDLNEIKQCVISIETSDLTDERVWAKVFQRLRRVIWRSYREDCTEQDLRSTDVLSHIRNFLDDMTTQKRKHMRIPDWYIEELTVIYKKWEKGDLSCDPNRGLELVKAADVNGTVTRAVYALDKSYQHYCDHRVFGDNELVNGQMWSSREQLMRDGAHGSKIGGISGSAKEGAYSILMSLDHETNKYGDRDQWTIIDYEGTARSTATTADDHEPTAMTRALITSQETGGPVRVVRAFKLGPNPMNVSKGYRYDGLYQVINRRLLDASLQTYMFRLRRLANQGRLRLTQETYDHVQMSAKRDLRDTTSQTASKRARTGAFGGRTSTKSSLSITKPPRYA